LKEKLRQRRLPMSGTKPELVARLYESIQEEESLLGGTEPSADIDASELLGNTGTLAEHQISTTDEYILLGINPEETSTNAGVTDVVLSDSTPIAPTITKPEISSPSKIVEPVPKKLGNEADTERKVSEHAKADNGKVMTTSVEVLISSEAKKRRADRFGISAPDNEVAKADVEHSDDKPPNTRTAKPLKTQDEKFLQRAKRFGLPIGGGDIETKVRKISTNGDDKIATVVSPKVLSEEEQKKREARRIRFGL